MLNRYLARFLCAACALVVLNSCGDSKAKGTGEFATVFVTATPPASALDSDVAKWVDATTGTAVPVACGTNSVPTVLPDDQVFTLTSTAYPTPNTGSSNATLPSDLLVQKITLSLSPANTSSPALSPAFQTQFLSAGQRVAAGSTTAITVRVVSDQLKSFFMHSLGAQSLTCANQGTIYSYYATVSFEALELTTNRVGTITAGPLLVNVSDFIDK